MLNDRDAQAGNCGLPEGRRNMVIKHWKSLSDIYIGRVPIAHEKTIHSSMH